MPRPTDPTLGPTCATCGAELPPGWTVCTHCEATQDEGLSGGDRRAGLKRVGHYRILRELGSGGMGTVFEAEDEKMRRRVALKVLSRYQVLSGKAEKRFEREAWIAGRLDHPNLVKVYDRGNWEGLSYYSMELVRGVSLYDVIQNMKRFGRDEHLGLAFGSRDYVYWALQQVIDTARGLDFAHRHGVIHRDVKPMNILLSRELKTIKITDFGIAVDVAGPRTTTEGTLIGTLAYMAPEQVLGNLSEISPATDVYALGVTLFELLTLELPFEGTTQEMYINAVLTSEARRASRINARVSRDLEVVLRKALEKEPSDRYATAADFANDLQNVLHFRPIVARPPSWGNRTLKWARRKPVHASLALLVVLGLPVVTFLAQRTIEHRRMVLRSQVDLTWKEIRWLSQKERNREVIERASELLRRDPSHVMATRARAIAHANLAQDEQSGDHERLALADAAQVITLAPTASWPHRLKAFLLQRFGRPDAAAAANAEATRLRSGDPSDDDLHFDGLLALESQDYPKARRLFSELTARRPSDPATFMYLGLATQGLEQVDEAIKNYRWALALNPDDHYTHLELGRLLTDHGALDEGASHLRQALELEPSAAKNHDALADNLLARGRSAANDPAAARTLFEQAEQEARASLALDPSSAWSRINLGSSLLERNRLLDSPDPRLLAEARDCYQELSSWRHDKRAYWNGLNNLCDVLIQLRELERALGVCGEVTELQPDSAVGHYNLAGIHAQMNRPEEALAALKRDVELGDHDWQYLAADPWFEVLRGDPRFKRLITEMRRAAGTDTKR